ncbi:MAG TPA: cytidylate kinase-like family protein [Bacteroidales bacterium]|jgi:cytidylate kinase|nr:cytidylate kinase-like family protein [Bacteroidales bacterium]HQB36936.1 cytidylate kinase-like family protein [Bacteroidales bacterium]
MSKFLDYFDSRHRELILSKSSANDGPVITISRQTGCDARQVAEKVVDLLNRAGGTPKWRWVDKDIIYAIAKELNTDTQRVETFYKGIEFSSMSEMIMAFSGGYISDLKVKKTIKDVVYTMAKEGYIVFVGRGGVSIAQGITDSLHVRLIAPFYWRVSNVMRKKNMDIESAEEYIIETDRRRFNLIAAFLEKKPVNIDYLFDVCINRHSFSIEDISKLLVSLYETKVGKHVAQRR